MSRLPDKIYLDVVGCPENRFDVAQLKANLESLGATVTDELASADTVVINTCGLTEGTEKLSREIVRKIQQDISPDTRVVISGCLPIINPHGLSEFENVTIIRGPLLDSFPWETEKEFNKDDVFCPMVHAQRATLGRKKSVLDFRKSLYTNLDRILYKWINVSPPAPRTWSIKIASGCNLVCSYCAIRISRGKLQSRPLEWITEHVKEGLAQGFRDISFLGTNVSAWGQELRTNFPALVDHLFSLDDSFRLRLRNMEPREVIRYLPEFTRLLKTGRIVYMEYPLESGSDRILRLMQRGYTAEEYVHTLTEIRHAWPKILMRSQIMAGFPGETKEDYEASMKLLTTLPLDYIEVYNFSPRPGTKAETLEGRVDPKVAKRRYETMCRTFRKSRIPHKLNLYTRHVIAPSLFSPHQPELSRTM
jgi:threonylcarbamoyladenosine tRNA methylthiotransferase MtaB